MNSGTRLFKLGSFLLLLYNPPEMQKGEMLSEEALEIAEKRKEAKGKGEKERYTHLIAKFQRIERRDKKAKTFVCVDHNKLWKILQDMGIPTT